MSDEVKEEPVAISFAEFLETTPPGQKMRIFNLTKGTDSASVTSVPSALPWLRLHCSGDGCNGERNFRYSGEQVWIKAEAVRRVFVRYVCSNCLSFEKVFALALQLDAKELQSGTCYKFGETPSFGPYTPARLLRLFGHDRDLFIRGRRCENQSLGIGAFTYYRRVVENHKNQILGEILKVAQKIAAPEATIDSLESAIKEQQFSKALGLAKDGVPESLLIDGHSPLSLLHGRLSEGIHDKTDDECLALASAVRTVLAEMADRISQVLKDERELKDAVSTLLNKNKQS